MKKRTVCLYRVSSPHQLTDGDMPLQKNACRAYLADRTDWTLVREYEEKGISGYLNALEKRTVMEKLLADGAEGSYDILLVFMYDRLGRREEEILPLLYFFRQHGIQVWSVKEGLLADKNPEDRLKQYFHYWQAGHESEKIAHRMVEKHRQLVLAGEFRGGCPPFGYELIPDKCSGNRKRMKNKLAILPEEAEVVQKIFTLYTTEDFSSRKTAGLLNREGAWTRNGHLWTSGLILRVLRNPVYKGVYTSGKVRTGRKIPVSSEQWIFSRYPVKELQIISEEQWDLAAWKIEQYDSSRVKSHKVPLLLSGMVRCAHCGAGISGRGTAGEGRVSMGNYVCWKKSNGLDCDGQYLYNSRKWEDAVHYHCMAVLKSFGSQTWFIMEKKLQEHIDKSRKAMFCLLAEMERKWSGELKQAVKALTGESSGSVMENAAGLSSLEIKIYEQKQQLKDLEELYAAGHFPEDWAGLFYHGGPGLQKILLNWQLDAIMFGKNELFLYFNESWF